MKLYLIILTMMLLVSCQPANNYFIKEIVENPALFEGKEVTIEGNVSDKFEGASYSGYGYSLVVEEGEHALFLRINNRSVHQTAGPKSPLQYYNNVIDNKNITIGNRYVFHGTINNTYRWYPKRVYLDIIDFEIIQNESNI